MFTNMDYFMSLSVGHIYSSWLCVCPSVRPVTVCNVNLFRAILHKILRIEMPSYSHNSHTYTGCTTNDENSNLQNNDKGKLSLIKVCECVAQKSILSGLWQTIDNSIDYWIGTCLLILYWLFSCDNLRHEDSINRKKSRLLLLDATLIKQEHRNAANPLATC